MVSAELTVFTPSTVDRTAGLLFPIDFGLTVDAQADAGKRPPTCCGYRLAAFGALFP